MTVTQRILDCLASLFGLLLLAPLLLVVGAAVKWHDGGPVIYRGTRVGKNGRLFNEYKFRSMRTGADACGIRLTHSNDDRITAVGRYLRERKLDELPQLFNVLKGDMSLVGPRPEDPRYVAHYTSEQRQVLQWRPGITSPASLRYRDEERLLHGEDWEQRYTREILPHKLAIELDYLTRRNIWTDVSIIFQTLRGHEQ